MRHHKLNILLLLLITTLTINFISAGNSNNCFGPLKNYITEFLDPNNRDPFEVHVQKMRKALKNPELKRENPELFKKLKNLVALLYKYWKNKGSATFLAIELASAYEPTLKEFAPDVHKTLKQDPSAALNVLRHRMSLE